MIDITHKSTTLRVATAEAVLRVSGESTIHAIREKKIAKGDIFEMGRAAGLFAVKKTSDIIPDCHPMPIESTSVKYEIDGLNIIIQIEVKTIYKTGVEVEAMHGASVIALTMYDMLKPIDKGIEISSIRLLEKSGGKSDFKNIKYGNIRTAVIVCSDTISKGKKEDKAGKAIIEKLKNCEVDVESYEVIPDEKEVIAQKALALVQDGYDMIIYTGGTGLTDRDITPEALRPLIDREIPGIMETARTYGQNRTPYSMLSRGLAGVIQKTLVLALPGSTKGASESMEALFPGLLHIFKMLKNERHD